METEKSVRKKLLTPKRVRTLVVFLILAAVAAAGFAHQRYLRSDSHIKAVWEDNKDTFVTAVREIATHGETFGKLSVGKCEKRIGSESGAFARLEELGISNVSYDGSDMLFYSEYDHYYIFRTGGESAGRGHETPLDSGWGYIKTKK
ncbi:MAG: hypothetical protein IJH80_06525 [Ruminococcus sp.]|nr:hypothetical protein [Ruminococcus sp.]